jgi:hypothetical protein
MRAALLTAALCFVVVPRPSAADTSQGQPVRGLTYGAVVEGTLTANEAWGKNARRDFYRFKGRAGDHVHAAVAAPTADRVICAIVVKGDMVPLPSDADIVDEIGRGANWTTAEDHITNQMAVDVTLPEDGEYDVIVAAKRLDLTEASPPVAYTLALAHEPVAGGVEWIAKHPLHGFGFHATVGASPGVIAFSSETAFQMGLQLAFAPGYQVSPRFGVDAYVQTAVALNPRTTPIVLLSMLVGPRLRGGNKWEGFTGFTAGMSIVPLLSGLPAGAMDANAIGFGARLERSLAPARRLHPDSNITVTLHAQGTWNGPVAMYTTGVGISF